MEEDGIALLVQALIILDDSLRVDVQDLIQKHKNELNLIALILYFPAIPACVTRAIHLAHDVRIWNRRVNGVSPQRVQEIANQQQRRQRAADAGRSVGWITQAGNQAIRRSITETISRTECVRAVMSEGGGSKGGEE